MRNIVLLVVAVLVFTGCNRKVNFVFSGSSASFTSWSEFTSNGKKTITRKDNEVTRNLETTPDVEIQNGTVTKFPRAALVKMQQSGGDLERQAELRENGGALELWIKDKEEFRRGSSDEEAWLTGFLRDVMKR